MIAAQKTRSNRPLTEFACSVLDDFIAGDPLDSPSSQKKGNTTAEIAINGSRKTFTVSLFDSPILTLIWNGTKFSSIVIGFTKFYDSHGQPSSTTAERLNGLLDRLGAAGIIPQGTRVFRDNEWHTTYFGRGDEKIAVGEELAHWIYLMPDPEKLVICGYGSTIES